MLSSKIQNIDYITFLISRLFCVFMGSCRKYERTSSLELSLLGAEESREGAQTPHVCTSPAQEGHWHQSDQSCWWPLH